MLKGRKAVDVAQQLLDLIRGDVAAAIFVEFLKCCLELLVGEDSDAEGAREA